MAKGERILVVDDQEDNVFILEQLLQRNGYQVAVARDGVEALEKAAEQRPDVVLLDINMPRMDGLEVCRRLKSDESMAGAAIILISARTEKGQRVEGLDAGADDYISKPFSPKELLARVRAQLRLKGRQDQLRDSNETLKEISIRDALTGLFNRGYLDARIEEEIARRDRIAAPLSVALVDIDLFKRVNDTRGHLCGDEVLREVGAEILASVRRCDVAARYGGEEFCVVLPDADRHGARRVAERLRAAVDDFRRRGFSRDGERGSGAVLPRAERSSGSPGAGGPGALRRQRAGQEPRRGGRHTGPGGRAAAERSRRGGVQRSLRERNASLSSRIRKGFARCRALGSRKKLAVSGLTTAPVMKTRRPSNAGLFCSSRR